MTLSKLSWRNAQRQARDYLVYFVTVVMAAALIYAFNGLVFSQEIAALSTQMRNLPLMIVLASLAVVAVVGWLVCTEGPSRGKSYTIRGGINSIGRSDRMDITITGDRTISAENHARLSYSDKNNRFNLLPGDGRNIVYLNGEEVFSPMPLKAYDQIDFGATKLLFIPLCGEQFTWTPEPGEDGHGTV